MTAARLLHKTTKHFFEKDSPQQAAALSFFSLIATAPILLILLNVMSIFLSNQQTKVTILSEAQLVFGTQTTPVIQTVIENISHYPPPNSLPGLIAIALLLFAATSIIRQLQISLNKIWEIEEHPSFSILKRVQRRLLALTSIVFLGVLLLVSFIFDLLLTSIGSFITGQVGFDSVTLYLINVVISFVSTTVGVMLIFKYLTDNRYRWRYIMIGTAITVLLFMIGRELFGLVVANNNFAQLYGAAGSILVFLIWIFYSALILLYGASFIYVYAKESR